MAKDKNLFDRRLQIQLFELEERVLYCRVGFYTRPQTVVRLRLAILLDNYQIDVYITIE